MRFFEAAWFFPCAPAFGAARCGSTFGGDLLAETARAAGEGFLVKHDVGRGTRMGEEVVRAVEEVSRCRLLILFVDCLLIVCRLRIDC